MRKVIKIFIASSIIEFANERMMIENFIRNVSDQFEEKYNIKLQPLLCENFDDAYSKTRKQEEYNEKIRSSELCFFIFFTKAGEYTREEFEVARKRFEETGKPKIYTYFKVVKENSVEQSLTDFMDELDKTFGHYYGTFEHIDTIKLRILLSLKLQEMDFLEIKAENGKCMIDNVEVMQLDHIAEFENNKDLYKLKIELNTIEEKYFQMKPFVDKGNCDSAFYTHYYKIASRRHLLFDEINELQNKIFMLSLQMSKDDVRGEISLRQKEAYRLFELGDYEGCMSVLNQKDIDDDFFSARQRLREQDIALCIKYIKEHKMAIDILETMRNYKDRFIEIEKRYEKIIPIIFSEKIEIELISNYVFFLKNHAKHRKALSLILDEIKLREDLDEGYWYCIPALYNEAALICYDFNDKASTEKYLLESATRYSDYLSGSFSNKHIFARQLGETYLDIATFYKKCESPEKAQEYFAKAENVCLEYMDVYKYELERLLAQIYSNIGRFYREHRHFDKARPYLYKALDIRKHYCSLNFEDCAYELSKSYGALFALCFDEENYSEAEKHLFEGLKIIKRLFDINSEQYEFKIASIYESLSLNYEAQKQYLKAKEYYDKALKVRKKYADEDPLRWLPMLAENYVNGASLYENSGDLKMAEKTLYKAIEINKVLANLNGDLYIFDLAICYNNMAILYHNKANNQEKAEEFYYKAIEYFEILSNKFPEKYLSFVGNSYDALARFYQDKNDCIRAIDLYKKAILVFEEGFKKNEIKFCYLLAEVYCKLGILSNDNDRFQKARYYAEMIIDKKKREEMVKKILQCQPNTK